MPWAFAVCNTPTDLKIAVSNALRKTMSGEGNKEELSGISYINPKGAFTFAAEKIIELYNEKTCKDVN